jgi:ribonuclease D
MTLLQSSSAEIAAAVSASGRLALDTEFMGEGRYRTLLCLVQLAVPDHATTEAVQLLDPLAPDFDGEPLARVLAEPEVEVVMHAGRQDVALLRRRLGGDVRNIFDTQVAAGFLGLPAQSSYEALLSEVLGVRLAKLASFTRWDARPLSEEQLSYAREDVIHMLELAEELKARLRTLGRLEWVRQECELLERASDERDPEAIFARLPRVRSLNGGARGVARELVRWRERRASERDRPVQSVLADAALLEIAKRRPSSSTQLKSIRGVNPGSLRQGGNDDLLAAVRRGVAQPADAPEAVQRQPPLEASDAPLIALSEALVRARSREANLAYELVASRADLQAIVIAHRLGTEEQDVRTVKGWRRELVGAELMELLEGRVSLSVGTEGGIVVDSVVSP